MVAVNHQDVAVALRGGAAFDGRIGRNRIVAVVAFVGILKRHRHARLVARHHDVGNAPFRLVTPVGMERRIKADAGKVFIGVGINRHPVNRRVPGVVVGKKHFAVQARVDAKIGQARWRPRRPGAGNAASVQAGREP